MITRSSAYRSSQGTPERNSCDKASSTMMKSSGLSTDPWWTPTFTSNSSLYPSPTRTRLRAFAYIPCTSRTIHSSTPSFLSAHQMTFRGTRSNAFSRFTKAMLSLLLAGRYFSCSCLTTKIASVVPLPGTKSNWESSIDTNCLMRPSTILSRLYFTQRIIT